MHGAQAPGGLRSIMPPSPRHFNVAPCATGGMGEEKGGKPPVSYGDFARLDLRVGRIVSAEPIPGKTRIVRGRVDLGGGDVRDVIIGGAEHYDTGDLAGLTVVAVANLEPRRVAGVESGAMLLAADVGGVPYWLAPGRGPRGAGGGGDAVPPGSPVL